MISVRAQNYPISTIRGLTQYALDLEAKGTEVISLNLGAPDLPTPENIKKRGSDYLLETKALRYGPSGGDPKLIQELLHYYSDRLGFQGIRCENLMITQGASEALELVIYTIANPGDTILCPDPAYANYGAIAYKYGVKLRWIPTTLKDGFHLMKKGETKDQAVDRLSKYITKKTKAILWSSPSNPTGTVYNIDELEVLYTLSKRHNLYLVADEVYRLLTFTNATCTPIPRAPSILDVIGEQERGNVIVFDSASKMISFCGGRIGIITASRELIMNMTNQAAVRGCPSVIGQAAVAAINEVNETYFSTNLTELKSRRDYLHDELGKLNHLGVSVSLQPPEGAFYLVVDLGRGIQAADYCRWLLTEYPAVHKATSTLFLTPMRMGKGGFYLTGKTGYSQIRVAYVLQKPVLGKAVNILRESLTLYKKARKGTI